MHLRKRIRFEEGEKRNEAWRRLTAAEKLASLDARLGKGQGAKRQRALLEVQRGR